MLKKIAFLFALVLVTSFSFAQQFPEKPGDSPIADFTGTLSESQKQQLDQKIKAFEDTTSTQIAVVIIKSVGDYDINEYGTLLGRKWGVGTKDKNNGVLLLVAIGDRKLSIQTGYGAEGALPDAVTQEIINRDIKPHFKEGDYFAGIDAGTDQIINYMKGEYKQTPKNKIGNRQSNGGGSGAIVIIVIVILIIIFRRRGGGGGGQIIGRRGGASPFWWFLAGNMLGGGGRSSGGWGSSGGGWGGGSSGGWGGFGGGSFGGGGSSGSW